MPPLPLFRIFPPAFLVLACLQRDSVYAVTVVCCPNTIMHLLCGSYFAQIAIKSNEKEWFHFEKKNNCWENEKIYKQKSPQLHAP